MKVFFRTIHLYLGLAAGLVISIVCFTGASMVFEKELQSFIYPERYKVKVGSTRVSIEQMVTELNKTVPGAKVTSVKVYDDPTRTVELSYKKPKAKGDKKKLNQVKEQAKDKASKKGKKKEDDNIAFMNPYSGKLISLYDEHKSFFYTMLSLHRWLLIGETGKAITGISAVIFLFILLTGIIMWWPENKRILKQRLSLKLNAGWKRANHDLHIVIGFYTAVFLFASAFTGLAFAYKWFSDGIYKVTGTENKQPEPPNSVYQQGIKSINFDQAYAESKAKMSQSEWFSIGRAEDSTAAIEVKVMPKNAAHENVIDLLYIDQYSGKVNGQLLYEDRNLGQRIRRILLPIHEGSLGGIIHQILVFLACIAGCTLPITGTIMWINRTKKSNKKKVKEPSTA